MASDTSTWGRVASVMLDRPVGYSLLATNGFCIEYHDSF